ncbi:MAG: rRNA maturation RNase YbeY [Defluviitaleaceae bacterium]|nr:rRNA maturation RNase YbeY [Defluviitaleaceae bacterium]
MEIYFDCRTCLTPPDGYESRLTEAVFCALDHARAQAYDELVISFTDEDEMTELNLGYKNKNEPTDVLSFPFDGPDQKNFNDNGLNIPKILGDIVICLPVAVRQAESYGHSVMRELAFLTVHGVLHLLGRLHDSEEDETAMRQAQTEILLKAGFAV